MIIHCKNHILYVDDFQFKCSLGKNGIKANKKEGDKSTPKGFFKLNKIYFRKDKIKSLNSLINKKVIKENMFWCDDPKSRFYNKLISNKINYSFERLYRNDNKYDVLIVIDYNLKKIVKNKGSAIFIHLTKNYKPTAGCIAISLQDMKILLKILKKKNYIKIY